MLTRAERFVAVLDTFGPAHSAVTRAVKLLCLARRGSQIRKYLGGSTEFTGLQIGAGRHQLDGWLKTDLRPTDLDTVYVDARKPMPFDDEAFNYIVAEHIIEHLEYNDARMMLKECYRVLKKRGVLRVSTPDIALTHQLMNPPLSPVLQRYVSWSNGLFRASCNPDSAIHVVNRLHCAWGHKFLYDANTLIYTLEQSGFAEITRRLPDESGHSALSHIDCHANEIGAEFNQLESLIVEATK
jgi:SAM-dependent methyltransferase